MANPVTTRNAGHSGFSSNPSFGISSTANSRPVGDPSIGGEGIIVHSNNPRTLGTFTDTDGSGNPFSTSHSLWATGNFV